MKRKRYSEEQIVRILSEAESLGNTAEITRRENIGQSIIYKSKYSQLIYHIISSWGINGFRNTIVNSVVRVQ